MSWKRIYYIYIYIYIYTIDSMKQCYHLCFVGFGTAREVLKYSFCAEHKHWLGLCRFVQDAGFRHKQEYWWTEWGSGKCVQGMYEF